MNPKEEWIMGERCGGLSYYWILKTDSKTKIKAPDMCHTAVVRVCPITTGPPQKVEMANVEGVLRTTKLGEGYLDARYTIASRIENIKRL